MAEADRIEVEVAFALPEKQSVIALTIAADATVSEAIAQSGILVKHPEIDLQSISVGIFGQRVTLLAHPVAGDRIEIYRPLVADPKQSRRARAGKIRRK